MQTLLVLHTQSKILNAKVLGTITPYKQHYTNEITWKATWNSNEFMYYHREEQWHAIHSQMFSRFIPPSAFYSL